jgi:hypothetical protein
MTVPKAYMVIISVLVTGIILGVFHVVSAQSNLSSEQPGGTSGNTLATSKPDLNQDEIAEALKSQDNILISPYEGNLVVSRKGSQAPEPYLITSAAAVTAAQGAANFLAGQTAVATLVSFTDPNYGPEVTLIPGGPGVVATPDWVAVPAYAVSFTNVDVPRMGTEGGTYTTEGVVFVDATTGETLEFVTIDLSS